MKWSPIFRVNVAQLSIVTIKFLNSKSNWSSLAPIHQSAIYELGLNILLKCINFVLLVLFLNTLVEWVEIGKKTRKFQNSYNWNILGFTHFEHTVQFNIPTLTNSQIWKDVTFKMSPNFQGISCSFW